MKFFLFSILSCMAIIGMINSIHGQSNPDQIIIGDDGIMRWRHDNTEVTGFGVNYTVPFAHAYRQAKKMGVDPKAAIDQDVYHFARLGLDLFRVHVWDCEISDTAGNLLVNEHLDLFDYLLFKLNDRGIRAVITPIAYWGNGWPDPDEPTPGFSSKFGKGECLVNPDAIRAQENYLHQFVNHTNAYSGKSYKDDPMILAFEVCNEPHHRGTPEEVTSFVSKMKEAIRSTGCTKPVFYNVSHSIHLADAYFNAGIDGGTFQWYPTGLGFQKELEGNMLPNVDRYFIPFDDVLKKNGAARFVYEFDAADMTAAYMYPAMARSFRTAGMQLATHFSYDPTFLAPHNTEYNTHFMNLVYAPQKALGLMICAEIFRTIPLYADYGTYPVNTSFGPFHVSYEDNLAEMVTDDKFIYTNNTFRKIKDPSKLNLIAGYGNSELIQYDGTGAYFLDRLGDGVWRLELMPDALIVDNLFARNDLTKTLAVTKYSKRKMKINFPEFANGYSIESVDWRDSVIYRETKNIPVELKPGVYLLMSPEYTESDSITLQSQKHIKLNDYSAPESNLLESYIVFDPPRTWSNLDDIILHATIISPNKIDSVVMVYETSSQGAVSISSEKMKLKNGNLYEVTIPSQKLKGRDLEYHFAVHTSKKMTGHKMVMVEKSNAPGSLSIRLEDAVAPLVLFEARSDSSRLNRQWVRGSKLVPVVWQGLTIYLDIRLDGLSEQDEENPNADPVADYTMRHYFGDLIEGRKKDLLHAHNLVITAQSKGSAFPVRVALVQKDGSAFGGIIQLDPDTKQHKIKLEDLVRVKPVMLPRPYPTFLPYYSEAGIADKIDITQIESLQISIGPGIPKEDWEKTFEIMLASVWLE